MGVPVFFFTINTVSILCSVDTNINFASAELHFRSASARTQTHTRVHFQRVHIYKPRVLEHIVLRRSHRRASVLTLIVASVVDAALTTVTPMMWYKIAKECERIKNIDREIDSCVRYYLYLDEH